MAAHPNPTQDSILREACPARHTSARSETVTTHPASDERSLPEANSSLQRRTLKIETVGDFARRKVKPLIRLTGRWLEKAGFKPGHRVQVSHSKSGELMLQFQETPPEDQTNHR